MGGARGGCGIEAVTRPAGGGGELDAPEPRIFSGTRLAPAGSRLAGSASSACTSGGKLRASGATRACWSGRRSPPSSHRLAAVRYQFVDCRWELNAPERGRELYLAGHIPGASFLDVDEDLSDLSVAGQGRHPLPSAERFAAAASRAGIGAGVFVVAYGSLGGRGAAVVAAAALRPRRLRRAARRDRRLGRPAARGRGGDRAGGVRAAASARATRWRPRSWCGGSPIRRSSSSTRAREPLAGRAEPDRRPARPDPGSAQRPVGGAAAAAPGRRARRVLRLRHHRLRRPPPGLARRPGGRLYPGSWSDWSKRGLPVERS